MNTKDIGNLGEHIAIVELLISGIQVSRPLGDNSRYDLILDIEGALLTCHIKSTNSSSDELAEFYLTSSQAHRGGTRHKYEVDIFICVDVPKRKVFVVPNTDTRTSIKIRYVPTKRGQTVGINNAEDYTLTQYLKTYH